MIVSYCSPFAGATNVETISKANQQTFEGTQTSYGMWMVPPDINNQVLVVFVNGDPARGFWIGCLYNQFMNNMVPGMAASPSNYQYAGKIIPVAEYNKWDLKVTNPDRTIKPYEATKFKGLGNQGLINDQGRGTTSASARRESPSRVFGIITPGPVIDENVSPANIRRKGGSSFIMDDETGSEYVQLTTKTGAQIRLDETNGFVYLINRDGSAWVQMDQKGNIDIFGATNNLRADRNINIEAGQNIYMKAAKDTTASTTSFTYDVNNVPKPVTNLPYYKYVGEGAGQGGNIVMQALNNMHTTVTQDSFNSVKRDYNLTVGRNMFITVSGNGDVLVTGDYDVTTTGNQNYHATGNIVLQAAEYNLTADTVKETISGTVNITTSDLVVQGDVDISGAANIQGDAGINGLLGVAGGAIIGTSVSLGAPGPVGPPKTANSASPATDATAATAAEIKQVTEKINILATWADAESKFKRNSQSLNTTVSTLPTYEPCPEHETFSFKSITGYTPTQNEGSKTYEGSGGAGNEPAASPPTNTTPGANNTDIPPTPAIESAVTKDFNMSAYQCQLKIHEGVKYVSYLDSVGLPTGGIGHLLRSNEITKYPIPTAITADQVSQWFEQDAAISISGAMRLIGTDVWGDLTDIRKRACADLCYNLGEGRLSKFKRFIAGMKTGDYNLAGQSLRDSKWFTQVARRGPNIITMIVNNVDPNGCDKKFPA
jgi:GH24 family phage-related lysozyme (muramidase)/phage baseplate assembly protein gpV